MKIGRHSLEQDVFVIAEIGNNHEGDIQLAQEMIHAAAASGVQAVKFQTIIPERLVAKSQSARISQLSRFAFSPDQFANLAATAAKAQVEFLSTPFAPEVVPWLDDLVPAFKVASGDNNYWALLEAIALTGKPVLLSTGMSYLADVKQAIAVIETVWQNHGTQSTLIPLHCVSAYPTPLEQANLGAIQTLAQETGQIVGYSDHTLGIEAAIFSVLLGARVIEKHFTLSKTQSDFRDHALSADPNEMAELVQQVQRVQAILGNGVKTIQDAELPVAAAARRSIVARTSLTAGHVIGLEDLEWLRPGGGLSPGQEAALLGRCLQQAVAQGEMLTAEMVA
ncbi:N-acetylneuraminate synthase family protein [Leptolyngbya sp. PCC 6406]|uniref:N-acetylneuraminate synthase family protein n=1 Tax=Leptolyngbya sp. PCC 6406 TaxID=1173264 RepID=UPI0002AC7299|nr:N-acetylneuraminate synthase family protein [Leptolyngbya sp. PCC 6406]